MLNFNVLKNVREIFRTIFQPSQGIQEQLNVFNFDNFMELTGENMTRLF